ncbi:hypothetical protein [Salipaludibacillus daqingensis]|uniref:hypothetical protein n=1 Tax=Salipaludibacillus daqingensis TaxID=3041001 RepID=UPI00247547C1|nr:hypothetical protein [Salipaludibacillus daqingensis]
MNEEEKDEIVAILKKLKPEEVSILQQVLYKEKDLLHRVDLRGSSIVKDIVDIVKERVKNVN